MHANEQQSSGAGAEEQSALHPPGRHACFVSAVCKKGAEGRPNFRPSVTEWAAGGGIHAACRGSAQSRAETEPRAASGEEERLSAETELFR